MIRLARKGKTKQPTYRLIISEKTKDTFGSFLEDLGFYNPRTNPPTINLKAERIKYWLSRGAQASPTVHNFLIDQKVIEGKKVKASKGKAKGKGETADKKEIAPVKEPAVESK